MFYNCLQLKNLDLFNQTSASSLTQIDNLFNGCSSLSSLDLSALDTTYVNDFSGIFNGCSSLSELIIKFNTNNANTMERMFANCLSLKTLYIDTFNTKNCNNFTDMFLNDEDMDLYFKFKNCPNLNLSIPEYVNKYNLDDNQSN